MVEEGIEVFLNGWLFQSISVEYGLFYHNQNTLFPPLHIKIFLWFPITTSVLSSTSIGTLMHLLAYGPLSVVEWKWLSWEIPLVFPPPFRLCFYHRNLLVCVVIFPIWFYLLEWTLGGRILVPIFWQIRSFFATTKALHEQFFFCIYCTWLIFLMC